MAEAYWDSFAHTGSVRAYLAYKSVFAPKEEEDLMWGADEYRATLA